MSQQIGQRADGERRRSFLFLQGPHGSFFPRLGAELARRGHIVIRVNLNGGDRATWPSGRSYLGGRSAWPDYVTDVMLDQRVTDLVLYGDCRPYHIVAVAAARSAAVRVHVFEEGYLRPDWITIERDGVNGHSGLSRDPSWYHEQARGLPAIISSPPLPNLASARRWGAFFYYAQATLQRWRFPLGPTHRPDDPIWEGLSYLAKFRRASSERIASAAALATLAGRRFALFPLQLSSDYQIRIHSPFPDMRAAARYVATEFARSAPKDLMLVAKEHPLDSGLIAWRRFFAELAIETGLGDRLVFVAQGDMQALVGASASMVTVNSTSGTIALAAGKPVKVLGAAVYDVPGLTDQAPLDRFWADPLAPDPLLFDAFSRVLAHRVLIPGAFLAGPENRRLVSDSANRLLSSGAGTTDSAPSHVLSADDHG